MIRVLLQVAVVFPVAEIFGLAAAPFAVGWSAEQLLYRWRQRRRAR